MPNDYPSQPSTRSPALAAALSFLWPGLGQLYLRHRRAAIVFALPAAAVTVLAIRELLAGPVGFALSMVNPSYALAVALAFLGVGIWRLVCVVHAFGASRPVRATPRQSVVLGVLLVAILAMHTIPGYLAFSAYRTDVDMTKPMPSIPYSTPDPSSIPQMTTPKPEDTPLPSMAAHLEGRQTILLTGVDSGPGRDHALTDTMMVVSLDADAKKVSMVSVPRDTTMFRLYWNGATLGPTFKLNALTTAVANRWIPAPDDPWTALKKEIGYLVGIPVDYYAVLDITGFGEMVDMVGGVDVVIPKTFFDPLQNRTWQAGPAHLDGTNALLYVRSRYGDNDYERASRQQAVLVALEQKMTTPEMILQIPSFLSVAGDTIHTDYPLDKVKDAAVFARGLPPDAVTRCVLGPPYSWHPDSATTSGIWTSQLRMDLVAALSVSLYGNDSAYFGRAQPAGCAS